MYIMRVVGVLVKTEAAVGVSASAPGRCGVAGGGTHQAAARQHGRQVVPVPVRAKGRLGLLWPDR